MHVTYQLFRDYANSLCNLHFLNPPHNIRLQSRLVCGLAVKIFIFLTVKKNLNTHLKSTSTFDRLKYLMAIKVSCDKFCDLTSKHSEVVT